MIIQYIAQIVCLLLEGLPFCTIHVPGPLVKQNVLASSHQLNLLFQVFKVIPTDNIKKFSELHSYQRERPLIETDEYEARQLLNKVRGHLVLLPLFFLSGDNLQPSLASKEGIAPTAIWT